ncbi:hypothetical protein DAEQUDRAFT_729823 [Daedalea quercina L-15889]|uniref:F-box domain-containing protein n=1 Tax=Daedalea quercina L-15889 TaxID=1314783 RepID=A0A165NE45_9APHY|nr:hypothetical protein DAEQUDRAFT_729823 [Daedalea quercina L-15889]
MSVTSIEPLGIVEPNPLRVVARSSQPIAYGTPRSSASSARTADPFPAPSSRRSGAQPQAALPVELFERIIEELAVEPDVEDSRTRRALLACALVCKEFHAKSRAVFCKHIAIMRWDRIPGFRALLEANPDFRNLVESIYLSGRTTRDDPSPKRPSGALASFPLYFAGKFPRLRKLHICCMNPKWLYEVHPLFYPVLGQFTSVTMLYMRDVTFSSASHFAALIDSLPNLEWFSCADLRWLRHDQQSLRLPRRTYEKLSKLSLRTSLMSVENTRMLHEFFAAPEHGSGIQRLKVGFLEMHDIQHLGVGRLLHTAGQSLRDLHLSLRAAIDQENGDAAATATPLSLGANTKIQTLTLQIHAFYKEAYDCSWLAPLLESQGSFGQLREVNIHMKLGASTNILSAFLAGISRDDCSRIDRSFTQPHTRKLKHIAWHIYDYTEASVHEAVIFNQMTGLFPRLHARELLRVYYMRAPGPGPEEDEE